MKQKKIFLLIGYIVFNSVLSFGQFSVSGTYEEKDLYILDTITISEPIGLAFEDSGYINFVVFSKAKLDSLETMKTTKFEDFIVREGYLFFIPNSFSDMLETFLYRNKLAPCYYEKILLDLRNTGNDKVQWISKDSKYYRDWIYKEMNSCRFLFCLAKGSFVKNWIPDDLISLKNTTHNLYYKIIVPVSPASGSLQLLRH